MYDYMDNLKKQRFTAVDRQRGGITSHKILKIDGNKVDIGRITVSIGDTSGLQVGGYLDFQFSYTAYHGKVNDYRCLYLGATPPQFIPKERE